MTGPMGTWARERRPPAPEALLDWTRTFAGEEVLEAGASLLDRARVSFMEALARPGRSREGAFALLVGDALLTWASEDAANDSDPEAHLRQALGVVSRLAEDSGPQGAGGTE